MKKLFLILILLLISKFGYSQVGINTTMPDAQLDIRSTNQATPSNTDGILIPKIDAFPLTNPTITQNSMLVYLTTMSAGKLPGFYYWDNATTSWIGLGSTQDADFYEVATTNPPDNINDDMFHIGNTSIGKNTSTYKLDVEETNNLKNRVVNVTHANPASSTVALRTALNSGTLTSGTMTGTQNAITLTNSVQGVGVSNDISGTSTDEVNGVRNSITTTGNGFKRGVFNSFSGLGTGSVYGVYNSFSAFSAISQIGLTNNFLGTPSGSSLGVYNAITDSGNGIKTGVENSITNSGIGIHYGIKNTISGSNALSEYAVYSEFNGTGNGNIQSIYNDINNSGNGYHYGTFNNLRGSGTGEHYGTYSSFSGTGSGKNYGNYNYFNTTGNGINEGIFNWMLGSGTGVHRANFNWLSGTGNGLQYGVYNYIDNTGNADKYGVYNYILPTLTGVHYGVYSNVTSATGYAGYFLGRISIGTNLGNSYILPLNRGTANQIMQTDAVGNVTWQNYNNFAWSLTGNSGTNATTNFLGTTDDNDLVFKRFNVTSGKLSEFNTAFGVNALVNNNTAKYNTAIGVDALKLTIDGGDDNGSLNTAVGYYSAKNNSVGAYNTSIGAFSLENNILGAGNSALGKFALNLTEGYNNVGIGSETLQYNVAGSGGTAIGTRAMQYSNSTTTNFDNQNVAVGFEALKGSSNPAVNTGNSNTSVGYQTLFTNSTGYGNTVVGTKSLLANTTGYNNSVFGASAMSNNTTGSSNTTVGDYILPRPTKGSNLTAMGYASMFYYGNNLTSTFNNTNTAIGFQSMISEHFGSVPGVNNIGLNNSVLGYNSLQGNSSGSNNTAIGYQTMFLNKTGNNNVALGQETLNNNILGSSNVALGFQAGYNELGSNRLYIENSNSIIPLIYGEFDNDLARINGNFRINSTTVAGAEMQVKNSNLFAHADDGNLNFGSGTGYFMMSTQDNSGGNETGGIFGDGNSVAIWSPGDGNGGQPAALIYFADEDNWTDNNGNPYDNSAVKSYISPAGAYVQISDKNKKENIVKIENALEKINQINGYTYQFKLAPSEIEKGDTPIKSSGVLAQELEKVLPEAVQKSKAGDYFVDYAAITPLLIEAIKSQNEKIKILETTNAEILKRLEKLENN